MEIVTEDYEKLGSFYLGREYDLAAGEMEDELLLYDSKDLVTHGVVLGMTGSGKTGLCMALLEEAALDGVPALVIDPKGDIANLLLNFPEFRGEDYRPWIDEGDAAKKGMTPDEFAQGQAELWEKGLAGWGQDAGRVRRLLDAVEIDIFTPGSNAGIPVSILGSLDAPPFEVIDDAEAFGDQIEGAVSGLLSLMGIDADPLQSREHILMANIFAHRWRAGENLGIEKLILDIQDPPFDKVGVLGLETFYPAKARGKLAMALNNLLASPGFATWLSGEPLNVGKMLRTESGKPRISIFSIAHLGDSERMFFVSLLLNGTLSWMRGQSGTSSLRALLYMDEIYGYLPPTQNPPSKKPMMTMLKQGRAFGLGLLLATQNPVDLDYKALSNIGSWFLGRLQTERDKMRVLDGLEGAAASADSGFDRRRMEQQLAGLGSRVFLLNNVHDDGPVIFHVRWVMSYLRGPLTRSQIRTLMAPKIAARKAGRKRAQPEAAKVLGEEVAAIPAETTPAEKGARPLIPGAIIEYFVPIAEAREDLPLVYLPAVLRAAEVYVSEPKMDLEGLHRVVELTRVSASARQIDWSGAVDYKGALRSMHDMPHSPCTFGAVPGAVLEEKNFDGWGDDFVGDLYRRGVFDVFQSPSMDTCSRPGESEPDFRVRLGHAAREKRDALVEDLRERYGKRLERLEAQHSKAEGHYDEQKAQASSAQMSSVVSIGSTILGALFGKRRGISKTSVRSGTSSASRVIKERRDVKVAAEKVELVRAKIEEMSAELEEEIATARESIDPQTEVFEVVRVKTLKRNISLEACGLAWLPYYREGEFDLDPAWI